jgi:hypothetical protein
MCKIDFTVPGHTCCRVFDESLRSFCVELTPVAGFLGCGSDCCARHANFYHLVISGSGGGGAENLIRFGASVIAQ